MEAKNYINKFINLFLLFCLFSFIGWLFETLLFYFLYDGFYDRGYLKIPLCPIYGFTIIISYLLLGNIYNPHGIFKKITLLENRIFIYNIMYFLLPTISEYLVAYYFDKYKNITLWDYSYMPLNINGYICLGYSLSWMILLFLVMSYIFPIFRRFIDNLPFNLKMVLSIIFLTLIIKDLLILNT